MVSYSLLTPGADNPKTAKSESLGITGAILHLTPGDVAGKHMVTCSHATDCFLTLHMLEDGRYDYLKACLNFNGRGGMPIGQAARIRRTRLFFNNRAEFMALLVADLHKLQDESERSGTLAVCRLNGTSDILWERIPTDNGQTVFERFPNIRFYDYTKVPNRPTDIPNYYLLFSLSENNDRVALRELTRGRHVAVVVHAGKKETLPEVWSGYPAIDGDTHDYRPSDIGTIVLLRAKGQLAKAPIGGFVRDIHGQLEPHRVPVTFWQKRHTLRSEGHIIPDTHTPE